MMTFDIDLAAVEVFAAWPHEDQAAFLDLVLEIAADPVDKGAKWERDYAHEKKWCYWAGFCRDIEERDLGDAWDNLGLPERIRLWNAVCAAAWG
jgi:hypothetical protein